MTVIQLPITAVTAIRPDIVGQREQACKNRAYLPELDALRLFAFLLVFCRHVTTMFGAAHHKHAAEGLFVVGNPDAAGMSPAWLMIQAVAGCFDFGLPLFFFLSSFLITHLLLIEKQHTGRVSIKNFYIRRILRIWPLYFSFLAGMALLAVASPSFQIRPTRLLASCFFVANVPVLFHGWTGSPIDLLWSVSIEEQFYIIWPRFAAFGRKAIVILSSILGAGSLIYLAHLGHAPYHKVWPNGVVQSLFFAGGAIVAVTFQQAVRSGAERILLFSGGWCAWAAASVGCGIVRSEGTSAIKLVLGYILVLVGTVLIFNSVVGFQRKMPAVIVYLGKISYGLYIFHVIMLQISLRLTSRTYSSLLVSYAIGALLALIATIFTAALTYRHLESPFLRLKNRYTQISSRPV